MIVDAMQKDAGWAIKFVPAPTELNWKIRDQIQLHSQFAVTPKTVKFVKLDLSVLLLFDL